MVCAAEEAMVEPGGGDIGVPLDEVKELDLSFAVVDGTGSHWWAGVGCAGSRGGAFMLLFGIVATGAE